MLRFPWSRRSQKSHSFTDEQIQTKIRELWKARGFVGSSPDEDRLKAISLLEKAAATSGRKHRLQDWGDKDDREFALKVRQFQWERLKTIISALGLGATAIAAIGLFVTYRQGEERLVTERFSKAVEQLGSKEISVRIGSIYALERIAKDSPKDHWTVMEVLTAFVRERSPNRQPSSGTSKSKSPNGKDLELPKIPTDVQSALTAIGRRDASKETKTQGLDLSKTYLVEAYLASANLQGAYLYSANLQGAILQYANLQGAYLASANLQGATLQYANLQEADLRNANLQRAELAGANLQGAYLLNANLQRAHSNLANLQGAILLNANLQQTPLYYANLQGATLQDANLQGAYLTSANLQGAYLTSANLQGATLDKANLQGAILLATDLRNTQKLTQSQLEGSEPPLLCNVALPPAIKVNPNRDCDLPPQELVKRYPIFFPSLEFANHGVDQARKHQWK